jgi:hypothetical protein
MCLGSGFPRSFKEAQEQILMIEQAKLPTTLGARVWSLFSTTDSTSDSTDYTCPVNIMMPETVTLNGENVNFVDKLTSFVGEKEDIEGKIGLINEDICKYRDPNTENKGIIKTRIVEKWKALKKSIKFKLHPDKQSGKETVDHFKGMFADANNLFDEVEQNTDVLMKISGGKRATRKRGKRNSKRAPRKTKSSRKKRRGKK